MALAVWCAFRWRDAPADTTCSGLAGGCGLELTADGCWLCTGVQVWGRGYLGLLFNNCLFSLGFCHTLELYDKDSTTAVGEDIQKQLVSSKI